MFVQRVKFVEIENDDDLRYATLCLYFDELDFVLSFYEKRVKKS